MRVKSICLAVVLIVSAAGAPVGAHDGHENEPPLVDAGLDQEVSLGSVVLLDAGGSVDPDGEIARYEWTIEAPDGTTTTPQSRSAETTQFEPEQVGRYSVTVQVVDDDGASRTDTLYVDVTEDRDSDDPPEDPPRNPPEDPPEKPEPTPNVDPRVTLEGPTVMDVGETATFSIETHDPDGVVVSHQFAGAFSEDGRQAEHRFSEPGSYTVEAVVTDDAGGSGVDTMTVRVVEPNDGPSVGLSGPETVASGSYASFQASAVGGDGSLEYFWSPGTDPGHTGSTLRRQFTSSPGSRVNVSVLVRDQDGHSEWVIKEVLVTEMNRGENRINNNKPEINRIDINRDQPSFRGKGTSTHTTYKLTAEVSDSDSDEVWVTWKFEDGTTKTKLVSTEQGSGEVSVRKSFIIDPEGSMENVEQVERSVEVTVRDESGGSATQSHTTTVGALQESGELDVGVYNGTVGTEEQVRISYDTLGQTIVRFGDGTENRYSARSTEAVHTYESPGVYTITVLSVSSERVVAHGRIDVRVRATEYTEYHYDRVVTVVERVSSKTKPAPNGWERGRVVRVDYELVETKEKVTESTDRVRSLMEEAGWTRVGSETETKTVTETTLSDDDPGSDWTLTERRVESEQRVSRWEEHVFPPGSKRSVPEDWEYHGERTSTEEMYRQSTSRPGSDWDRIGSAGTEHDGYDYRTFDDAGHAGWTLVSSYCVEEVDLTWGSHCIDTDYQYRQPEYETVYQWKKVVEYSVSVYDEPIYEHVWLNEYERETTEALIRDVWQKEVYEGHNVYEWTKSGKQTEPVVTLSDPDSGAYVEGSLSTHTHSCEKEDGELSSAACNRGGG